ncbi:MAG TPA: hypothetical protein VN451_05760, partial [Chitinophagaceae bacterium]|nr:hypothetical protein [Chitinophagaceae bacterium]
IYTGSFNGNAMTGQGKLIDPNGDIYEGSFKNGYFEGAGTFNYANGNKFSGHYIKHMREGKGTIWYANGNRYEGDFHVGLCDIGTMYYKNGGSAQGSVDYEDVFTKFVIEMNDDFVNEKPKEQKVEQGKFNSPTNALEYLRSNLQEAYTPDFQYAIVFDFSLDKVVLRYHSYYKDQHAKGSTVRIEKSFLWRDTEFHYSVGPQGDESIVEFLEIKNSNGNEKVTCRKRNPYIKAIYDIIDAVEYLKSH